MRELNNKEKALLKKFKEEKHKKEKKLEQEDSGLSELDFNEAALSLKEERLIEIIGETEQGGCTTVTLTIQGEIYLQNHPNL